MFGRAIEWELLEKNPCANAMLPKQQKKKTLHNLRHTGATLLIYNGVNLQTIANTLGHSNTAITSEVYLYPIEEADQTAAVAMDNAIKKAGQK